MEAALHPATAQPERLQLSMRWVEVLLFSLLAGQIGGLALGGRKADLLYADVPLLLAGFLLFLDLLRTGRFTVTRLHWPYALMAMSLLPSFFNANDLLKAAGFIKGVGGGFLAAWIGVNAARTPKDVDRFFRALTVWSVALSVMLILAAVALGVEGVTEESRSEIRTPMGAHNFLAGFLVALAPLLQAEASAGYGRRRTTAFVALALSVLAVFLTYSRGAVLSLAIVMVAGAALAGRKALLPALALVLVVSGFFLTGFGAEYRVRIARKFEENRVTSGRTEIWAECWRMFEDHPVAGAGLNSVRIATGDSVYFDKDVEPHSLFFGALAETGLIGLAGQIAFWAGLAGIVGRAWRKANTGGGQQDRIRLQGIGLSFFGVFVHGLFNPTLSGPAFLIFFMLVAAMAERMEHWAGQEAGNEAAG